VSRPPLRVCFAVVLVVLLGIPARARAGHELPFYPSFYPQEIKIDSVEPAAAASLVAKSAMQAYVGGDPFAGRKLPADLGTVESLGGFLVVTLNPATPGLDVPERRCERARRILGHLVAGPGWVAHPYPVTPYHADYLQHFDLVPAIQASAGSETAPRLRARGALAERAAGKLRVSDGPWDATVEEVTLEDLLAAQRSGLNGSLGPPWVKQGWYHAWLLHARSLTEPGAKQAVAESYRRLTSAAYESQTEQVGLERRLVRALTTGCERVEAGYVLRREVFSAEFSQGIENIVADSQTGFNSPAFVRTVKLKDFPWNGWLRVGVAGRPAAAWNPVGGFNDPAGRLLWAALGDAAAFPAPYLADWVPNRLSATPAGSGVPGASIPSAGGSIPSASGSIPSAGGSIPEDALKPDGASGQAREIGKGKTAEAQTTYRVAASAFHDGTRMTAADAVYPVLLAARASAAKGRDWLAGVKVLRTETEVKKFADISFTFTTPVIDVYTTGALETAERQSALPWSPLPWTVLTLIDEAQARGWAATTREEASRRHVPWLDLARDQKLKTQLAGLVETYASQNYVPPLLRKLVAADEAQHRWQSLRQFYQRRHHFLVTNGPYQLGKWSETSVTLDVFRDFTYPLGVGAFDRFALPLRAWVVRATPHGDRLEVQADVERAERFLRSYRTVREPMGTVGAEGDKPDIPVCRFVAVGPDGEVARAGTSREVQGGRLVVPLKGLAKPGPYTVLLALYVADNTVNPQVTTVSFRPEGTP
jgi:hypothetical protein